MKKILVSTLAIILIVPLLGLMGFKALENLKGSHFKNYLQKHMETFELQQAYDFNILRRDIEKNSLILVGEIHGFHEPIQFDVKFLEYLYDEHGVRDYFVEMDYSQAYFLNKFNRTGNLDLLDSILNNWVVVAGRKNEDYRNKWIAMKDLFQEGKEFKFHGNNNLMDVNLLNRHLHELDSSWNLTLNANSSDSLQLIRIISELENHTRVDEFDFQHLLANANYRLEGKYREEILTQNFLELYDENCLKESKVYGYYGLGHTLQAPLKDGYKAMALRLKENDSWFKDKVLSINFVLQESNMVVKSETLPGFMQDEGPYTRLNVEYDDILTSYLFGVNDLIELTSPESKSIVRLDGYRTPYNESTRLSNMTKILPIGAALKAEEGYSTTDYYQYLIFVRNSDWAKPIIE